MCVDAIASRTLARDVRYLASRTINRVPRLDSTDKTKSGTRSLETDHMPGTSTGLDPNRGCSHREAWQLRYEPTHRSGCVTRCQFQADATVASNLPNRT